MRHVVVAGLIAVLLGGCGGNDQAGGTPGAASNAPATGEAKKDDQQALSHDPKQDVKVTSCESSTYTISSTVEVTNRYDKPSEYYGQINFLDPAGKVINEGEFNSGSVAVGEVKTKDVPGQNLTNAAKVTCEVSWIKLDTDNDGK
jgi:hypothetical protein